MTPRRAALAALLLLGTFALYFLNRGTPLIAPALPLRKATDPAKAGEESAARAQAGSRPSATAAAPGDGATAPFNPADFPIAVRLNAADSTIRRDLETLDQIFEAWRTNFPREGNPIGENAEITRALTGDNRIGFALIPPKHPAINASGELCDRWGTPFRFHQISGEEMEIRSAGPDGRFATGDDAVWAPSPGGFQKTP